MQACYDKRRTYRVTLCREEKLLKSHKYFKLKVEMNVQSWSGCSAAQFKLILFMQRWKGTMIKVYSSITSIQKDELARKHSTAQWTRYRACVFVQTITLSFFLVIGLHRRFCTDITALNSFQLPHPRIIQVPNSL